MSFSVEDRRGPRSREWPTFLIFTLVILPALAVAFVGGYGFVVWISHEIYGPPNVAFEAAPPAPESADSDGPNAAPTDGVDR